MLKQKVTAMMLAFVMMFSVSVPAFAESLEVEPAQIDNNDNYTGIKNHSYYDEELNADVISFTVDENGNINYLSEEESRRRSEIRNEFIESNGDYEDPNLDPFSSLGESKPREGGEDEMGYMNYPRYTYEPLGPPHRIIGTPIKIGPTYYGGLYGKHVTPNVGERVTNKFEVGISFPMYEAIMAKLSYSWVSSAPIRPASEGFDIPPNKYADIFFYPEYDLYYGYLTTYLGGEGSYRGTSLMRTYSVATEAGYAAGEYQMIIYR